MSTLDRSFGCGAELNGLVVAQELPAGEDLARKSGLAVVVGRLKVVKRDGIEQWEPVYDRRGSRSTPFRRAGGTLLLHPGQDAQAGAGVAVAFPAHEDDGVCIEQVDAQLGCAASWDEILLGWGHPRGIERPETAASGTSAGPS
jgi:hypothetical protein